MFVDFSRTHNRRYGRQGEALEVTVAEAGGEQEPTGVVVLSVEVLEQLLADAGWERAS